MKETSKKDSLLLIADINDKFVQQSFVFDDVTKHFYLHLTNNIRLFVQQNHKINSYQYKTFISELLNYWNNSIKPETEYFWEEINNNNLDVERREPLKFALDKNRFQIVEHVMDARNYWQELKNTGSIKGRYSIDEIEKIDKIIHEDENRRYDILRSCLQKKIIPQTKYLKFGECMAYFHNCDLFRQYFSEQEKLELYKIWSNFKSETK